MANLIELKADHAKKEIGTIIVKLKALMAGFRKSALISVKIEYG